MRRVFRALLIALLATSLGACVTQTTSTKERAARGTSTDANDPDRRAQVRLELAALYLGRGQNTTALDEVKRALAAKPNMHEAHGLRGLIYANMGDASLAEESFQRALQLAPRDGDVLHNYGWFLCQQRRFSDADTQFETAMAQPQYRETVRTLLAQGVCSARAGRWAEAERALVRSYELDPGNPVTAYNLSEVLMRRGELDRARFYVARINAVPELSTAQSLWLAARIERGLGNQQSVQEFGRRLRERFPQANETLSFEQGRFNE